MRIAAARPLPLRLLTACSLLAPTVGCKSGSRESVQGAREDVASATGTPTEPEAPPRPLYDDAGFHAPDRAARRAAVGSLESLPPTLQRAFSETTAFRPVNPPDPGDWLAEHREPGQSFARFQRVAPNVPSDARRTIYVQPIGATADAPIETLSRFTADYFQLPVKTLPSVPVDGLPVTRRLNDDVEQLLAPELLTWLAKRLPEDAYCLIGVTMVDLYPDPEWNFVFGYASLSERVGVHSFARYDPSFYGRADSVSDGVRDALILDRGAKVMAHEIGHMFGMRHCVHYDCVMNGSNHLDEADGQPMHLCPLCLRKLQTSVGFEPDARYRQLSTRYEQLGMTREATWTRERAAYVAGDADDAE